MRLTCISKLINVHIMTVAEAEEREKGAGNLWRNDARKPPKSEERHESTHPISSTNSKQDKIRDPHLGTSWSNYQKSKTKSEPWKQQ